MNLLLYYPIQLSNKQCGDAKMYINYYYRKRKLPKICKWSQLYTVSSKFNLITKQKKKKKKKINLLLVWDTRTPYPNCLVIACWCKHLGPPRVPTYTVYSHFMATQNLDKPCTLAIPYINLSLHSRILTTGNML